MTLNEICSEEKIQKLLDDADELVAACGAVMDEVTEYELLIRCLSEQTVMDGGKRRLRKKEDGMMNSAMLQNPSDAEATYRNKAGKIHRGYAANLEESLGKSGSVVTNYQYEQNIHSDSQFLQDAVAQAAPSAETVTMITDGGYGGGDNVELARQKNIDLVTTALIGKDAPDALAKRISSITQGLGTALRRFLQTSERITALTNCLVENKGENSFSEAR